MYLSKFIPFAVIYLCLLITFVLTNTNNHRFLLTSATYLYTSYLFDLSISNHISYFIMAILFVITEYFYINYIANTWDYRDGSILQTIPSWLLPLWMIVIAFVNELSPHLSHKIRDFI